MGRIAALSAAVKTCLTATAYGLGGVLVYARYAARADRLAGAAGRTTLHGACSAWAIHNWSTSNGGRRQGDLGGILDDTHSRRIDRQRLVLSYRIGLFNQNSHKTTNGMESRLPVAPLWCLGLILYGLPVQLGRQARRWR